MIRDKRPSEIAAIFGVKPQAVYDWLRKGCPAEVRFRGAREEYFMNLEEIENWLIEERARSKKSKSAKISEMRKRVTRKMEKES